MLRVIKVTSPMSVGTWILSGYTPLALGAAASAVTGKLPRAGLAATLPAAVLGPAVASYTSVLLADIAVPAWHDAHRELPFVPAGSAVTAAGGLGMLAVRPGSADGGGWRAGPVASCPTIVVRWVHECWIPPYRRRPPSHRSQPSPG